MTQNFSKILRRRLVLAGVLASGLFPLSAFSVTYNWYCTNQIGQHFGATSSASCAWHYPDCESDGSTSCPDPGLHAVASIPGTTQTTTATLPTKTGTGITGTTGTNTWNTVTGKSTSTKSSKSLYPVVKPTSTVTVALFPTLKPSTPVTAPTFGTSPIGGATDPKPVFMAADPMTETTTITPVTESPVLVTTASTDSPSGVSSADLANQAAAENKIAIGEAQKLQAQMQEIGARHAEAVQYYQSPGIKDPMMATQFFGSSTMAATAAPDRDSAVSGQISGNNDFSNISSDVSAAKEFKGTNTVAMSTAGKSLNKKSSSGASTSSEGLSAAEIMALKKASKAELVAKIMKDTSLRDKVKKLLADSEDGDADNSALAAALAQADGASGNDAKSEVAAMNASTGKASANSKRGNLTLEDMDSQREVGRLLASFGADANAAAFDAVSEPLFDRVHSAHTRSLERGNVLSKLRRR
ncbi:MAG: hypothetical protein ACXVBE_07175 [Bdellovibrionota bacterium]